VRESELRDSRSIFLVYPKMILFAELRGGSDTFFAELSRDHHVMGMNHVMRLLVQTFLDLTHLLRTADP
jgi:hypothetical protein